MTRRRHLLLLAVPASLVVACALGVALLSGVATTRCQNARYRPSPTALADIPGTYLRLYRRAAQRYRLGSEGWSWLAGIGSIETDHGRLRAAGVRSGANPWGAAGPMQIGIGGAAGNTWARYGADGNQDGRRDVYDPADAIPAAARYLRAAGAPADWRRAAFAYNHAGWYVADVARRAARYRGAADSGEAALVDDRLAPGPAPASRYAFPARPRGPVLATAGDHRARPLGNWQSDNAIDIGVPTGSRVLAVADGVVTRVSGSAPRRGGGVVGGYSVTLRLRGNQAFYTHLVDVRVRSGQRVRTGQTLGTSGYANDVEHLHFAVEHGDPQHRMAPATANGQAAVTGCTSALEDAAGPASLGQMRTLRSPRAFEALPAKAMAGGRPPAEMDARVIPDVLWLLRTYRLRVTAGRELGHASHGDGTGIDLVPAPGGSWSRTARAATAVGWTRACGSSGAAPACPVKPWVRFVGYNGYRGHGDPAHAGANAHLHLSWAASNRPSGPLAPPNAWVRVFPAPNPEAGT